MAKSFIVKVQVPLCSSEADAPCLVYDRNRQRQFFMPVDEQFRQDCAATGKAYYRVKVKGDEVTILERVKDQPW